MWIVGWRDGGFAVLRRHFIIEGAGEDARRRRFADTAHAGQNIGLMDAAEVERVRQRRDHRLLADEIVEICRPIFARQHAIRRGRGPSSPPAGRREGSAL